MKSGRIIVITGSPGTGKTTASAIVAKESVMEKSVHMHTDDFYHYLSKGAIPPRLPESNAQNLIVIEAFLEAAKRYARGGYDVIVDGIIGPWFLDPWLSVAREGYEIHYIILKATKEETIKRAIGRSKLDRVTNIELVETMWEQFHHTGTYEPNVIDTTDLSINDTVFKIKEKVESKTALLHGSRPGGPYHENGGSKMEYKGHDLTISYLKDGKVLYRDMEVNADNVTELARIMAGLALVTLSAVYGDGERVIDVACEGRLSYAVITEVGTDVDYTYLDPHYTHLFTPSGTLPHVFTCADMEGFEQDETYREALAPFSVNGAGCPALHVCRDKQVMFQIIRCFLADGTAFTGADWLKSCI